MSTILRILSWTIFMARRDLLTPDERLAIFGVPTDRENLARHNMLSPKELALVAARRGDTNQIGFAVQLGLLRHPGFGFTLDAGAPTELVAFMGEQIGVPVAAFGRYASRPATASVHAREAETALGTWTATTGQRRSAAPHRRRNKSGLGD
jgi:TnpA family transposase